MDKLDVSDVPPDLVLALDAQPGARSAFERAGDSYRRGLMALLEEARDEEHRAARLDLVVRTLQQ